MIETLMALWNRGVGGRLVVMVVAFFCICISISLLFVTVGSAWGSLFAHGRTGGEGTRVVNSVLITATAPTSVATASTAPAGATPTITPNPCVASPTEGHGHTSQVDVTRSSGGTSVPSIRTSATPERLRKTPTPGVIITPEAGPSPTPPATTPSVTPTVVVTPTATTLPAVTPTVTTTPAVTPTTSTTPASTPTTGIVPTDTVTPNVTPTPTVTAPASSPTATTDATTGTGSRHVNGGGPLTPGTPPSANNGQPGQGNCFSDNLAASGEGSVLSLLQNFFWILLVSSLLGTALFCAQMYRVTRTSRTTR